MLYIDRIELRTNVFVCVYVNVGGGCGWEWVGGCTTGPSNADLVAVVKLFWI